jgi:glycosyltransferase involved in cell wall biosynthesis
MEIPIITSAITGCKEIVLEGKNGFLCKPNNAEDLARRMVEMMELSQAQRTSMGRQGRELAGGKFDIGNILTVYDETLLRLKNSFEDKAILTVDLK